jgi:hypothetical protein
MTLKAGFIILKYLLLKPLSHRFSNWKFLCPLKRPRNVSKIPLPKSVKENLPRDRPRPDSPSFRVPKQESNSKTHPTRHTSAPPKREKTGDNFGARLHNKAHEIEMKKQKIRKSLKVNYSFRPTLAENTNRWLNKVPRENRNSREEIAVVSSASILNFTRDTSQSSMAVQNTNESYTHNYPQNYSHKVRPIVLKRSDFILNHPDIKENYFN